jgi:hypothetical protein
MISLFAARTSWIKAILCSFVVYEPLRSFSWAASIRSCGVGGVDGVGIFYLSMIKECP